MLLTSLTKNTQKYFCALALFSHNMNIFDYKYDLIIIIINANPFYDGSKAWEYLDELEILEDT